LKDTFVTNWNGMQNRKYKRADAICRLFAGLLMVLVLQIPAKTQWMPDWRTEEYVQTGIEQVYNFELDSARATFQDIVELYPEHPGGHFFVAMVDWMSILVNMEDTSLDDQFFEQLERVIGLSDDILKERSHDISALFFKGGSIGFRGRLRAHRGAWVRAANDGRRALPIVRRAQQLVPNNADIFLGMGIYNYYAAVIPEKFPWVKPFLLFFPKGDKEEGLDQLRKASKEARYAGVEASYFLMQILYFNERNYREGYELAYMLHNRFPNNPLFLRYYGRFNVALGRWEEAYKIFLSVSDRYEQGQKGYSLAAVREAEYYVAQYLFINKEMEKALDHYAMVLEYSAQLESDIQSGFVILATLRTGMIYDALGEREKALVYYSSVRSMDDYQGSRNLAQRYMETPYTSGSVVREINPNMLTP
jgi:hypothetical protein